jgi:hypothetical protein
VEVWRHFFTFLFVKLPYTGEDQRKELKSILPGVCECKTSVHCMYGLMRRTVTTIAPSVNGLSGRRLASYMESAHEFFAESFEGVFATEAEAERFALASQQRLWALVVVRCKQHLLALMTAAFHAFAAGRCTGLPAGMLSLWQRILLVILLVDHFASWPPSRAVSQSSPCSIPDNSQTVGATTMSSGLHLKRQA